MWFFKPKNLRQTPNDSFLGSPGFVEGDLPDFVDAKTGRHALDFLYERFAKPQLSTVFNPDEPSIYIRHQVGQKIAGGYAIERLFEDPRTGFYAEGRVALDSANPPVLTIRGYGSWFPFERVLEDTPDVFVAGLKRQFHAAIKQGAIEWLKYHAERGNKPDLIGESLGGKVAQQIAAQYSDYIRSTVTFNPLGVSQKLLKTSKAKSVFHYFTLGERYAFWANKGDYIPGYFFIISKNGESCYYKLEEAIIRRAKFSRKAMFQLRKRKIIVSIVAQLILLKRHNELILNRPRPIVIRVERNVLSLAELESECRVLQH